MDITSQNAFIQQEAQDEKNTLIGGTPAILENAREIFTFHAEVMLSSLLVQASLQ